MRKGVNDKYGSKKNNKLRKGRLKRRNKNKQNRILNEINLNTQISEGNISEGNISEGNIIEGKVSEGKISEGKISEGNISEGNIIVNLFNGDDLNDTNCDGTNLNSTNSDGNNLNSTFNNTDCDSTNLNSTFNSTFISTDCDSTKINSNNSMVMADNTNNKSSEEERCDLIGDDNTVKNINSNIIDNGDSSKNSYTVNICLNNKAVITKQRTTDFTMKRLTESNTAANTGYTTVNVRRSNQTYFITNKVKVESKRSTRIKFVDHSLMDESNFIVENNLVLNNSQNSFVFKGEKKEVFLKKVLRMADLKVEKDFVFKKR